MRLLLSNTNNMIRHYNDIDNYLSTLDQRFEALLILLIWGCMWIVWPGNYRFIFVNMVEHIYGTNQRWYQRHNLSLQIM